MLWGEGKTKARRVILRSCWIRGYHSRMNCTILSTLGSKPLAVVGPVP
jgi:hypothetical protein